MKIRDRIVDFRRVKASELIPNEQNWRKHPQKQKTALAAAIEDIGFADVAIARQVNGKLELLDGHLRRELAEDQEIPVVIVDLDDNEARKLLLTLDPLAGMAEADNEKLEALLRQIETESEGVERLVQFVAKDHGIKLDMPLEDPPAEIDKAAELQKKWKTERGQLWVIKGKQEHRLLCGDATCEEDVGRVMDGEKPLMMVTDPPYGVKYDPEWRNKAAKKGHLSYADRRVGRVSNDDRIDWSEAYKLFSGDVAYIWSSGGDPVILTGQALQGADFQIRNQIIWQKPHFPISRGAYTYQHEPCWYGVRKGKKAHWIGDANESTVWRIPLDQNVDGGHSTQKPLECMARPIRNHACPQVYDPFCGTATTGVACEQLGRQAFLMDIDPAYCAVSLERMSKLGCHCELQ